MRLVGSLEPPSSHLSTRCCCKHRCRCICNDREEVISDGKGLNAQIALPTHVAKHPRSGLPHRRRNDDAARRTRASHHRASSARRAREGARRSDSRRCCSPRTFLARRVHSASPRRSCGHVRRTDPPRRRGGPEGSARAGAVRRVCARGTTGTDRGMPPPRRRARRCRRRPRRVRLHRTHMSRSRRHDAPGDRMQPTRSPTIHHRTVAVGYNNKPLGYLGPRSRWGC